MKNIFKTSLILTVFFTVSNLVSYGQSKNEIVIIRTQESYNGSVTFNPEIVVISPDGETKVIELNKGNFRKFGEDAGKNAVIIQKEIKIWLEKGFEISHFSTAGGDSYTRTFIIMTKEEE